MQVTTGYHTSTGMAPCHTHKQENIMTIDSSKQPQTTGDAGSAQPARTDDLLASGADRRHGAEGFTGNATPEALKTGMEGIGAATVQGSGDTATSQTVQDNATQVRNKQDE
jgi:hypothetical protein